MAEQNSSFNLLYKVEAQKTFVDKLYDFVVGPARLIVVGVMIVIIGVFAYRFVLDSSLRDQKKLNDDYTRQIEAIVVPGEPRYKRLLSKTDAYGLYLDLYRANPESNSESERAADQGKLHFVSQVINDISEIRSSKYEGKINISEFSSTVDVDTTVRITGTTSAFLNVDAFVNDIKALNNVADASSTNLGGTREQTPRYQIDIKLDK